MLLAADVGGTKTDLALFTHAGGPRHPLARRSLPSDSAAGLAELVERFLADHPDVTLLAASFDVAGPVVEGRARLPNLDWDVDVTELRAALGLETVLLANDLEATAAAIPLLEPADLAVVRPGRARAGGPIGVIAPGTGLGEAFLTWDGQGYRVHASEGGHADFAPTDHEQIELLEHLWREMDHVSYERVCSGRGMAHLYEFLRAAGDVAATPEVERAVAGARDPTPIIVAAAMDPSRPCPRCRATVDLFLRILGAETGNLGLRVMATGGVYLAGGIPPRVAERIEASGFLDALDAKGRQSELVAAMPVHLVREQVALFGAARRGLEVMAPRPEE